jgi:hypothetical protein
LTGGGAKPWDHRNSPIDSIWASASLLKDLIGQFGNTPEGISKAVAAYNTGPGNIAGGPSWDAALADEAKAYWRGIDLMVAKMGHNPDGYKALLPQKPGSPPMPVQLTSILPKPLAPTSKPATHFDNPQNTPQPVQLEAGVNIEDAILKAANATNRFVEFVTGTQPVQKALKLPVVKLGVETDRRALGLITNIAQHPDMAMLHAHAEGGLNTPEGRAALMQTLWHNESQETFTRDADLAATNLDDIGHRMTNVHGEPLFGDLAANKNPVDHFLAQFVAQTLYDPLTYLGGLGIVRHLALGIAEKFLPTTLAIGAKTTDFVGNVAGAVGKARSGAGAAKAATAAEAGQARLAEIAQKRLAAPVKRTLTQQYDLLKKAKQTPAEAGVQAASKFRVAAQAAARAKAVNVMNVIGHGMNWTADWFDKYGKVKRLLATKLGEGFLNPMAELLQRQGAAHGDAATFVAVHQDAIDNAVRGLGEKDRQQLLKYLNNRHVSPEMIDKKHPKLLKRYQEIRQATDSVAYTLADQELRTYLDQLEGFSLPLYTKRFVTANETMGPNYGVPRNLLTLNDVLLSNGKMQGGYRPGYVTIPHELAAHAGDAEAQKELVEIYQKGSGKVNMTWDERQRYDPYLEKRDHVNITRPSGDYLEAMYNRIRVAGSSMAAHDLEGFAEHYGAKYGVGNEPVFEDFFKSEAHKRVSLAEAQKLPKQKGLQYAAQVGKDVTDWGKSSIFINPLPHMGNITFLMLLNRPALIPGVIERFSKMMTMTNADRARVMGKYIDVGLLGPAQGLQDFNVMGEYVDRGSGNLQKFLMAMAQRRATGVAGFISDVTYRPVAEGLAQTFRASQHTLWTWDDAAKTVLYDANLSVYKGNEARAAYETLASLVDYSNRAPLAEGFRFAMPFATWATKVPIAVTRAMFREPQNVAMLTRLDPKTGGGTQKSLLGQMTQSMNPIAETAHRMQDLMNPKWKMADNPEFGNATHDLPHLVRSVGAPITNALLSIANGGIWNEKQRFFTYYEEPIHYIIGQELGILPTLQSLSGVSIFQHAPLATWHDFTKQWTESIYNLTTRQSPVSPPRAESLDTQLKHLMGAGVPKL